MVEGGMSCVKYILFVFNFIFVIFGGLLVYFGFTVIQESQNFEQIIATPDTMAIGVIIVGFFVFLIAFLGCCGAIMESYCILLTFGIVVAIILTIELILSGVAFAFKSDLRNAAEHGLKDALSKYNTSDPDAHFTRLVDDLQWNVKCCGISNASDWRGRVDPLVPEKLPLSCCPKTELGSTCALPQEFEVTTRTPIAGSGFNSFGSSTTPSALVTVSTMSNFYEQGCVDAVVKAFGSSLGPVGGVCLAVALFQMMGILFAFCLGRAVKREYQVV